MTRAVNKKHFIIATICTFIAIYFYEFALHVGYLMDLYLQTPDLWRTPEDMEQYIPYIYFYQFSMALAITWIFVQGYENRGLMEGIRFGTALGLLMGASMFASYTYMPISGELAIKWFLGYFVEGLIVGVVLSLTYKNAQAPVVRETYRPAPAKMPASVSPSGTAGKKAPGKKASGGQKPASKKSASRKPVAKKNTPGRKGTGTRARKSR